MCENIGVLTNEYYLIFEHHQGPNIEKTLESKHAEDGINPLPSEECFTFVPIAHKGKFLLVYQSELILFIEVYFLELEILMAVIEKLDHSLHLELTVSLLYGQFYVLFIMLIYCQPFHLDDIDEIPEYLLKEGEEGVVRHDTKYPLRDAYVKVIDVIQSLIDRFE